MGRPEPSNKTVIRFITTPVNSGHVFPYGGFVFGYGWGGASGKQHRDLARLYNLEPAAEGQYAGYLYLDDGKVKLFSGGSASLFISESTETNKEIEMLLEDCGAFARILGHMFPLVSEGIVPHAMVALFW